ncbi:hypothetical protein LLEC1_03663 [Akanthomyces lecanii]|uniref:Myb-like DNA-binding domain-containing protein n=1 Tax=Cordyceps confragosa TaxID=2714763 RepID=A0A179ID92_CORDF|nr:hypothetical protein LLEC1_03663 [Akanthomyces lecanii]
MSDETGKPGPTPSEAIFFFNIVQHMKNKGDIDWEAVAESSGFKNAGVAKVRFGQIKRKYGLDANSPSKKTGTAGDIPSTPTKVTKSRKATGSGGRGRKVKKAESEEEEDADEMPRQVKEKSETPPGPAIKGEADSVEVKTEQRSDGFTYF